MNYNNEFEGLSLAQAVDKIKELPVAFAVVREDSMQDLELMQRYFREGAISVLMVASGGDTAALLVQKGSIAELTLVDSNKAQLDLTRLKLNMLCLSPEKRLQILGYRPMDITERASIIKGFMQALDINEKSLGDLNLVARYGLDFIGRYEKIFALLREHLRDHQRELKALFEQSDVKAQQAMVAPGTQFGSSLDNALNEVMSQENLVEIFGVEATANRLQDFSRHFAERIRVYLSHHLAAESPWLATMLLGTFHDHIYFPWLSNNELQHVDITYRLSDMNTALSHSKVEHYHVIHLSNIIDWLKPADAKKTLDLAYRALKPGGAVIVRQLNSNIEIPTLTDQFEWNKKLSEEFLHDDRSFFYINVLVGVKPRPSEAPLVTQCADEVLQETPIIKGLFFKNLPTMSKEVFVRFQKQFFFAVDYFSRPMAALVMRLPKHKDRIDIIHNIVEEHGDFEKNAYHSTTFKKFLSTLGVQENEVDTLEPSPVLNMFNAALIGACVNDDPIVGIACDGIIEYAFADISAIIANTVIERGWIKKEDLVHYDLHAELDKIHAEEFFKIIESHMIDPQKRKKIIAGLKLGAYIFNRLYEDLYQECLNA